MNVENLNFRKSKQPVLMDNESVIERLLLCSSISAEQIDLALTFKTKIKDVHERT
jgi:hypothetical protein